MSPGARRLPAAWLLLAGLPVLAGLTLGSCSHALESFFCWALPSGGVYALALDAEFLRRGRPGAAVLGGFGMVAATQVVAILDILPDASALLNEEGIGLVLMLFETAVLLTVTLMFLGFCAAVRRRQGAVAPER